MIMSVEDGNAKTEPGHAPSWREPEEDEREEEEVDGLTTCTERSEKGEEEGERPDERR